MTQLRPVPSQLEEKKKKKTWAEVLAAEVRPPCPLLNTGGRPHAPVSFHPLPESSAVGACRGLSQRRTEQRGCTPEAEAAVAYPAPQPSKAWGFRGLPSWSQGRQKPKSVRFKCIKSEVIYPGFINNFLLTLKPNSCPLHVFIAGISVAKKFPRRVGGWSLFSIINVITMNYQ